MTIPMTRLGVGTLFLERARWYVLLGFAGHGVCHNDPALPLESKSSHTHYDTRMNECGSGPVKLYKMVGELDFAYGM